MDKDTIDDLKRMITDPEYAKSMGVTVYTEIGVSGDKCVVLEKDGERVKFKIND